MRVVFLVGFMGVGKTTVGQRLAQQLQWEFKDLDDVVSELAGKSIPTIFRESGEAGFREQESEALRQLIDNLKKNTVVALGGGAFVQTRNFELIRTSGHKTVHLSAQIDEILKRCRAQAGQRPLLDDENQFRQLYERRRDGYMKADIHVETSGKPEEVVAAEITSRLGLDVK